MIFKKPKRFFRLGFFADKLTLLFSGKNANVEPLIPF